MIVVDVTVIAYLLIQGPETEAVEGLLRADPEWAMPLLWRSEWNSILAVYVRRGHLDVQAALECIDTAKDLVLGREYLVDGADVMALVESSPCSAYDCEYVALARTLGVTLITYDGQVLAAFPDQAASPKSYLSG